MDDDLDVAAKFMHIMHIDMDDERTITLERNYMVSSLNIHCREYSAYNVASV